MPLIHRKQPSGGIKSTPESRRAYKQAERDKILTFLGNKCVRCGFTDKRALQVDHIHGGGVKHIKAKSTSIRYREILADTKHTLFQLLCANCNWIKRTENGETHSKRGRRGPYKKRLHE